MLLRTWAPSPTRPWWQWARAAAAAVTGVPVLRTVGNEISADQQALAQDQKLVSVRRCRRLRSPQDRTEADGAAGPHTPVDVYLPAGRWIDLYSGQVLLGGPAITRNTPPNEVPPYLKVGSAIGFNMRTPDVRAQGWDTDAPIPRRPRDYRSALLGGYRSHPR